MPIDEARQDHLIRYFYKFVCFIYQKLVVGGDLYDPAFLHSQSVIFFKAVFHH